MKRKKSSRFPKPGVNIEASSEIGAAESVTVDKSSDTGSSAAKGKCSSSKGASKK